VLPRLFRKLELYGFDAYIGGNFTDTEEGFCTENAVESGSAAAPAIVPLP
jgi:hypothetical protein